VTWTLASLADRVRQVTPCEVIGDGGVPIGRIDHPRAESLAESLVPWFDGPPDAAAGRAPAAWLVPTADLLPPGASGLVVERPRLALGLLLSAFEGPHPAACPGLDPTARIPPTAVVDPTARVEAFAVIGDGAVVGPGALVGPHATLAAGARVGARTVIEAGARLGVGAQVGEDGRIGAGVVVGDGCTLGARVLVQPNAVIGAAGFSYDTVGPSNVDAARGADVEPVLQPWIRIPSHGVVEIGDDVEIGAGACIDRPTLGGSRIGAGTKIDNLVQVAHHVEIGEHCLLAAQTGVAGSCVIGDGAVLGGQVGVVDHQRIGRLAVVLVGADVHSDVPPGGIVAGAPARPRREWFKRLAAAGRMDSVRRRLRSIEERIGAIEESDE